MSWARINYFDDGIYLLIIYILLTERSEMQKDGEKYRYQWPNMTYNSRPFEGRSRFEVDLIREARSKLEVLPLPM